MYIKRKDALEALGKLSREPYYQHDEEDYYIGVAEATGEIHELPSAIIEHESSQCYESDDKLEYWGFWIECECGYSRNTKGAKFCGGCGKKINVIGVKDFYAK